jgi:hypothetical protein
MAQGYESFYLRAADPAGGLGFWIRYTVHRAPGRPPTGSLWFTFFEADAPPLAAKTTVDAPLADARSWIRIADASLGADGARGRIELAAGHTVSWDLSHSGAELFPHLPRGWMYAAPLPRTKPVSVHPTARLDGTLVVGDRTVSVDGWPGMVGHNWGSEHAERWIWLHGTIEDSWLDIVLARIKVGRWTTPWTGFGALCLDGERHRLGGLSRVRTTRVDEHPDRLTFEMTGEGLRVLGSVSAPQEQFVGWVYADPHGSGHDVSHCSIADLDLTVEQPGQPVRGLRAAGTAAYELGMREHDHGIEIQPFPDG